MPKVNIRVTLPRKSPIKLIHLNKRIIKRHEDLGAASPLNEFDMDDFKTKTQQAQDIREQAAKHAAQAQALNEQARILLGINIGQNSFTEGTLYNMLVIMRNRLLLVYRRVEESLSPFGFNVVIRKSKMPKNKKREDNKGQQGKA